MPKDVKGEIQETFRHKANHDDYAANLISRFNSLPCLLISSVLGGGIWEERRVAAMLKPYLMKKYPDFYEAVPQFEFSSDVLSIEFKDKDVNKIHQFNQWIIDNSVDHSIKTVEDLNRKDLRELQDLDPFVPSNSSQLTM